MTEVPTEQPTVYCPRCDNPYSAINKRLAWKAMLKHLRTNHPDYYEDFKEDNAP